MTDNVKARTFTIDELTAYLVEVFPEFWGSGDLRIEELGPMKATLRLAFHPRQLRPGGTIAGPTMFGLCDSALYAAILSEIGPVALAVTTSATIASPSTFVRMYRWRSQPRPVLPS